MWGGYTANAAPATNPAGTGDGVAVGTGSSAPKAENVAIGKEAKITYSNGASAATGDIVVGSGAKTNNYVSQGGGIAIGQNAFSENMAGTQEEGFNFKQTTFTGSGFLGLQSPFIPADPTKVVTGIAIGQNAYARTGSVMIGTHNFKGKLYDTDVDTSSEASMRSNNIIVHATTLGTNSFNNGAFGVVTGAYSAITGAYDGGSFRSNASQNFGATITGSLNSIESKTASSNYSGVANSIVGVANRTFNSNGALVFGAGNEITNSVSTISAPTSSGDSVQALQKKLMEAVRDSNGGGATLAIGGGNKADYTQASQMIGVKNTLTGTSSKISKYNLLNGYNNKGTDVSGVTVMGTNRTVSGAENTIVFGTSKAGTTTKVSDAVILGTEANATVAGGVALGAKSIATTDKGAVGYDPSTTAASTETSPTWKSTAAAVSVGDAANNITRQITNVAAGLADTDAVNVAQLKKAVAGATADGNDKLVANNDALTLNGNTLSMSVKDTAGNEVKGSVDLSAVAGQIDTRSTVKAGENVSITDKDNDFHAKEYTINVKADGKVEQGNTGIVSGDTVYNETHVKNDGTYVKKGNSAGDNLSILDKQVSKNTDDITNLGNTIYSMNNAVGELGERINKVGAGAAALAGLHPLDFDPEDKWDIAAGFGNYRNASAAAVGLFYRPNERTMLNVGFTMGDSRNMINAGVSVKLGRGDVYTKYSKVEMANRIEEQNKEIAALKAKDAERDAQMKDVLKQLEELRKGK